MKSREDREKFLTRRTAYIWSALVGVVGVVLVVVFDGGSGSGPRALSLLGQALFSAGVVAVTFGWISSEENEVRIGRIIGQKVQDIRQEVKSILHRAVSRAYEGALVDRSLKCHLEAPGAEDSLPEYLYQVLTVSDQISDCPAELRFVGVAGESPSWSRYLDDKYQFRWELDEGLDPTSDSVFRVDNVRLNGRVLDRPQAVHGDGICEPRELRYEVPSGSHGRAARISFVVTVRKFLGNESRISIKTKLFHDVIRADYMLSVGSSVGVAHIHSSCDAVTTWTGGLVDHESEEVTDPSGRPVSRSIRLLEPVQQGSEVSFSIERPQNT